jgi:hypothetical protein
VKRPRLAQVVANTAMLWVVTAIACVPLWAVYDSAALITLVAVTLAAGSAIAIAGALWRLSSPVVVAASIGAFLLLGVPLAVPSEADYGLIPTAEGFVMLLTSVALAWKQLLTVSLPVGSYQGLLVPAFVLVLVSSVVSLTIALRARLGDFAALPPILLFLCGLAFGPGSAIFPVPTALALFAVVFVWLMWRRWYARRSAIHELAAAAVVSDGSQAVVPSDHRFVSVRTVASAVAILVIAGIAGAGAAAVAPPRGEREVLRTGIVQPFDPRAYVSPLAGFRQYLKSDRADSVMFTVSGLPENARLRVATLDYYDGIVYSVGSEEVSTASGSFTRVPSRYDQSGVDGEPVALDVAVEGYSGLWLPSIGKLERVRFDGDRASELTDAFYYNDTTGTAAVIGGLQAGDEYRLEAVLPQQPGVTDLASVTPGTSAVPSIGTVPAEVEVVLERYTAGIEGAGQRLVAMVEGLRAEGYVSHGATPDEPRSRSGHAADRITELLTDQRMIGDEEQYAVTAALMARQLGFASRVVFGFVPEESPGGGPVAVTGRAVSAWIEVDTDQFGWVTLDPTPTAREIPEELPEEPAPVSRPQSVIPPPVTDRDPTTAQAPPQAPEENTEQPAVWLTVLLVALRVAGWVGLALAVLTAPFLGIVAAKMRRRRKRRRAADPLARIGGGWQEYRDAVIDHGYQPPASATRRELAALVGGSQPAVLAAIADRAVFSPRQPSDDEADRVWRTVAELRTGLDSGATRWQRLRAMVSPRSLGNVDARGRIGRRSHGRGETS